MEQLSRKQLLKVSSFSDAELADWIKSRLRGNDPYFPVKEEDEIIRYDMLLKSFYYINDKTKQDEFLKILKKLTEELLHYPPEKYCKESKYIYELNYLCRFVDRLEYKDNLYTLAIEGRLKKINAYGYNLHLELLKTLSEEPVYGDEDFWLQCLHDRTQKEAHIIAFSALRKEKYNVDIFFDLIDIYFYLVKNSDTITLDFVELIYNHGDEAVRSRLEFLTEGLYSYQKQSIKKAFAFAGKSIPF